MPAICRRGRTQNTSSRSAQALSLCRCIGSRLSIAVLASGILPKRGCYRELACPSSPCRSSRLQMTAFQRPGSIRSSPLLNAARNTGGRVYRSVTNIVYLRTGSCSTRAVRSSMSFRRTALSKYVRSRDKLLHGAGSSLVRAQQQALGWIDQQIQGQASFLSYVDDFWVLTLIPLATIPLIPTLRNAAPARGFRWVTG